MTQSVEALGYLQVHPGAIDAGCDWLARQLHTPVVDVRWRADSMSSLVVKRKAVRCLMALGSLLLALTMGIVHAQVSATTSADVVRVVDGDTVDVQFDNGKVERLRLIGMDTQKWWIRVSRSSA